VTALVKRVPVPALNRLTVTPLIGPVAGQFVTASLAVQTWPLTLPRAGVGVGDGLGVGVGDGVGEGVGDGVGDGVPEGVADGVGVGDWVSEISLKL
jgi:hypothetical protein